MGRDVLLRAGVEWGGRKVAAPWWHVKHDLEPADGAYWGTPAASLALQRVQESAEKMVEKEPAAHSWWGGFWSQGSGFRAQNFKVGVQRLGLRVRPGTVHF